ncbi:MAG: pyruvate dehydrogenase complex dihydrolipoamide acetyltransferase [Azospirillaceae bacterium]
MAKIVGLPKLSPTMEEGTLARWEKSEGDRVAVDDLIAEIETDKATMEWRAFDPGVLLKRLVEEGAVLEPDAPVAIFGEEGEDISKLLEEVESGAAKAEAPKAESAEAKEPSSEAQSSEAQQAEAPQPSAPPKKAARSDGRVLASPLVRKLGREHDIDLSTVDGSGPGGRIIKRDIDDYLSRPRPSAPARGERRPPRVEKLSSMRRTIARRLTESKQTVPHFYLTIDCRLEKLLAARKELNARGEADGIKLSVNDMIIKAAAVALKKVPAANAAWTDEAILLFDRVDISVAVATPSGLITPIVKDAANKGLGQISGEVKDLATRARDGKLKPEEYQGGTFSVSNLGMYGIREFAAIINPPQGSILAVGQGEQRPVVEDGALAVGTVMSCTLSVDHRVVDGAVGAEYLAAFKKLIEDPMSMLL